MHRRHAIFVRCETVDCTYTMKMATTLEVATDEDRTSKLTAVAVHMWHERGSGTQMTLVWM